MQDQDAKDHWDCHHGTAKTSSRRRCLHSTYRRPDKICSAYLQSALPSVLQTLNGVSNQGVDIQLKILQALLSVLTYNPDAHGEILGNVRSTLIRGLTTGSLAMLQASGCPSFSGIINSGRDAPSSRHAHL
jgi:hypothetical protein